MKIKSTFKIIISWFVAFLVLELGSRIIAYQPILISWTKNFKNGTFANNSNSNGMHEFWDNGITKYKFGEYGNRISSKINLIQRDLITNI